MMNTSCRSCPIWFGFIVRSACRDLPGLAGSLFGIRIHMFLTKHYRKIYDADIIREKLRGQRAH